MELTAKSNRKIKLLKTEGYWLYDDKNNKHLDVSCGSFAHTLGYGNQEIISEITSSLSRVTRAHLPLGQTTDDIEEMKDFLLRSGNWGGVIWALSGSGAVEAAVHIGKTYFKAMGQSRNKILTFGKGWHGTTDATKKYSGMWPLSGEDEIVSLPTPAWKNVEQRDQQESDILSQIRSTLHSMPSIGQILINPNPWFNGLNPWSKNFWENLDRIRQEFKILIVTDDVASCWGKAKSYHSYKRLMPSGMQPDISALGKAITAGYAPLSAAVANKHISEVVQGKVNYSHTFQPYIGGIAAMKATVRIIQRDNLFTKAEWIQDELHRIGKGLKDKGTIESFTAYGTCAAFDLSSRETGKELKDRYYGLSSDMAAHPNFRVCVPLIADKEYFDNLESVLEQGLK